MKKLVMALVLFGAFALIQAQTGEEEYYTSDNDEHTSDGTASELITSEPIAVAEIIGNVDPAVAEASSSTPEMDLTASMDASYSAYQTKINIPLWYRWRDFSFNASVPYFITKEIPNFGNPVKTDGLGDVSVGASYGKYIEQYKTYLSLNTTVKLPTGDEENMEEKDGFDYPIPLGSGSTDIAVGLGGYYFLDDSFTFKGNLLYKMNGEYDTDTSIQEWDPVNMVWVSKDVTITTDIGDLFLFTAGADYRWQYRLTFGLDLVYGSRFAAEIEGDDQKNGMTYMDIDPSVKYSISLFEFVLGAKIPVYTELETYASWVSESDQKGRSMMINFRTNYRIF